jgi:hypothetical protein
MNKGVFKTLELTYPGTAHNSAEDTVVLEGGLTNGDFELINDEGVRAYWCIQEVFEWWEKMLLRLEKLEYRLDGMRKTHGTRVDALLQRVENEGRFISLVDRINRINEALDELSNK